MSYPNIQYLGYGKEKIASSVRTVSLGQLAANQDGRLYQYGKASTAAAISAGYLCCGSVITDAGTSVEFGLVAATAAVGDATVVVTLAAGTAAIADQWAGGYLVTASSTGTGIGYEYKIASNNSAAAGSACTITLEPSDPIAVAIAGGTTRVGLRENLFNNVVITPAATSLPGNYIGVPPVNLSAGYYGWFQIKGEATGYVSTGTAMVTGDQCVASTGYAGAFGVVAATSLTWSSRSKVLGEVRGVANTTGFTVINLHLV